MTKSALVTTEVRGSVILLGLNRPEKRNAFNAAMLQAFSAALTEYEREPSLRCALIFAHGPHFTGGLDLADVAPRVLADEDVIPPQDIDPWGLYARERSKPVVCALHGHVLTLGIELALACDVRLATTDTSFAQREVERGIFPFGGGTFRAVQQLGWGNAMHYMLTGDTFDAAHALRIGLVQELVTHEQLLPRAIALAERIAANAPLGVSATLENASKMLREGQAAAAQALRPEIRRLMATEDAREGMMALLERRAPQFRGR